MHKSCASAVGLERNLTNIDCMCLWLTVAVSANMDDDQFGAGGVRLSQSPAQHVQIRACCGVRVDRSLRLCREEAVPAGRDTRLCQFAKAPQALHPKTESLPLNPKLICKPKSTKLQHQESCTSTKLRLLKQNALPLSP